MRRWPFQQISLSWAAYVRELKSAAMEALSEETVLISVEQLYHVV
jgi:hypothetical protein